MRSYREKESLKRNLIALGSTLLLYGLLFLLLFLWENRRTDLDLYSGPMQITLGKPEGEDTLQEGKETSAPAREEAPAESEQVQDNQQENTPEVENAQAVPAAEQTAPAETPSVQSQTDHGADAQGESTDNEESGRVVKGQTYGNTHELYMDFSGGSAGRNVWVPVYLYMPVPQVLDAGYVEETRGDSFLGISAEDDQRLLKQYYRKFESTYRLKEEQVGLDNRPEIWLVLERSGYDLSDAPYRKEFLLRPIELHFTIAAAGSSGKPELLDLEIEKSSGIEAIDQAVLYAFNRSSYYNNSDRDLKGRFVYRFQ